MSDDVDLGSGHILRWLAWAPDDLPANRERFGVPLPNLPRFGAVIYHIRPDSKDTCAGTIYFDSPEIREHFPFHEVWRVHAWSPLTLTPSILCTVCGDHGYIKAGRWRVAA